ncbi:hypothetical protein GCM10017687_84120 [Streptomyces echinatus]
MFLQGEDVVGGEAAVGDVDLLVPQRLDHAAGVLEVADGHRVVLPLGEAAVVVVADQDGLVVLLERLELVRPRAVHLGVLAQGVGRVVVRVDDRHGGGRQHEREGGVGLVEVEDDLAVAGGLHAVEAAEQSRGAAGASMVRMRSMECRTASAVSGSPSANFRPERSLQR